VTVRSATTRDYYDEKPPQSLNEIPPRARVSIEEAESTLVYGPLLTRVTPENLSYGGMLGFRF
jgi:hypothetical protein